MIIRLAKMLSLVTALAIISGCGDLGQDGVIELHRALYTPDGSIALFSRAGISIFDGELQMERSRVSFVGMPRFVGGPYRYGLSADGMIAAVSAPDGGEFNTSLAIYSLPTGARLSAFWVTDDLREFALSPNGDLVAALDNEARLSMVDTATGVARWTGDGRKTLPAWSPDGATFYDVDSTYLDLEARDPQTGSKKWSQFMGSDPVAVAMTAGGTILAGVAAEIPTGPAGGCDAPQCPVVFPYWSSADGSPVTTLPAVPSTTIIWNTASWGTSAGQTGFACTSSDDLCIVALYDLSVVGDPRPVLRSYRSDGSVLSMMPLGYYNDMALSPDGQFATVLQYDDHQEQVVRVYRLADGVMVASRTFSADIF